MGKSSQAKLITVKAEPKKTIAQLIESRRSKELVIAFCGPVGSAISGVVERTGKILKEIYHYEVKKIKVSELITKYAHLIDEEYDVSKLKDPAQRYLLLQNYGNDLRLKYETDILGQLVVKEISVHSTTKTLKEQPKKAGDKETHKIAFLIDSLKHPEEVKILRAVYRNMFFLFGIFCSRDIRRKNLEEKDIKGSDAEIIMDRDKDERLEYGQKLNDTLQYADFFINNNNPKAGPIERFLSLILASDLSLTPTQDEFAMYLAQSAALRSGCLSRQIGAAILDKGGQIISTGHNDVPKSGGGLYSAEDTSCDKRCIATDGLCKSYDRKQKIKERIKEVLSQEFEDKEKLNRLVDKISTESKIDDLIEFSRAVHAEMEAIVSAARVGVSVQGGTLYCTTFPCHHCARHIIAAGIKKVLFIEPYEKSLALRLHADSLILEPSVMDDSKVIISHFEGVAPRQYINLFKISERKHRGKVVTISPGDAIPALPEYLDAWQEVEAKIVEYLENLGFSG
jgi:deoxycytidylate deaminase